MTLPHNKFAYLSACLNNDISNNESDSDDDESTLEIDNLVTTKIPSTEGKYESRCSSPCCTPDHIHSWKLTDGNYTYGPYTCYECKESFRDLTKRIWKKPTCLACRSHK